MQLSEGIATPIMDWARTSGMIPEKARGGLRKALDAGTFRFTRKPEPPADSSERRRRPYRTEEVYEIGGRRGTLSLLSRFFRISPNRVLRRLEAGWSVEDAFTVPLYSRVNEGPWHSYWKKWFLRRFREYELQPQGKARSIADVFLPKSGVRVEISRQVTREKFLLVEKFTHPSRTIWIFDKREKNSRIMRYMPDALAEPIMIPVDKNASWALRIHPSATVFLDLGDGILAERLSVNREKRIVKLVFWRIETVIARLKQLQDEELRLEALEAGKNTPEPVMLRVPKST